MGDGGEGYKATKPQNPAANLNYFVTSHVCFAHIVDRCPLINCLLLRAWTCDEINLPKLPTITYNEIVESRKNSRKIWIEFFMRACVYD